MAVRGLILILLGASLALGGVFAFTDVAPGDFEVNIDEAVEVNQTDSARAATAAHASESPSETTSEDDRTTQTETQSGVDKARVEAEIHKRINEIRQSRGLNRLKMTGRLREIARGHSADMATKGYFSHESPGGKTMEDRYREAGYECRVDTGTGNQYATGAENIAYTYAYQSVRTDEGIRSHNGNETKIAHGIVTGWMNSDGHRQNILQNYWKHEGIGVATTESSDGTRVYATQNFC